MPATILVVDDDANVRELLKLHLSAAGYEVHVAADAIAAGYLVLRSPPDPLACDGMKTHQPAVSSVRGCPRRGPSARGSSAFSARGDSAAVKLPHSRQPLAPAIVAGTLFSFSGSLRFRTTPSAAVSSAE